MKNKKKILIISNVVFAAILVIFWILSFALGDKTMFYLWTNILTLQISFTFVSSVIYFVSEFLDLKRKEKDDTKTVEENKE